MDYKRHLVFFDVESTSRVPTRDRIISFGAILVRVSDETGQFETLGEFHHFVQTNIKISAGAMAVHHITPDILAKNNARPLKEVLQDLVQWIQTLIPSGSRLLYLCGHNIDRFDTLMLYCNCVQDGISFETLMMDMGVTGTIDTLEVLRSVFQGRPAEEQPHDIETKRPSFALGACYECFCKKKPENAHDALADCRLLYQVMCSPSVASLCSLHTLMRHVKSLDTVLKLMRSKAGIVFAKEEGCAPQNVVRDQVVRCERDIRFVCPMCITFIAAGERHTDCMPPTIPDKPLN